MQSIRYLAIVASRNRHSVRCARSKLIFPSTVRSLSSKKREEDVIYEEATSKFNRKEGDDAEKRAEPVSQKGFLEGIADKALKFIGMDEESRERRENKRQMNAEIDKALRGTGLMGGLVGSLIKSVSGAMVDQISQQNKDRSWRTVQYLHRLCK